MMIITARISGTGYEAYTETVYQHDKNATLVIDGIDLPEEYEVHFGIGKERGISVACKGDENGVRIPDSLLSTGGYIYAWVYDAGEETGKRSLATIVIPVTPRPVPIPIQTGSSSGSSKLDYEVDENEENLTFLGAVMNRTLEPNITEEDN